MINNVVINHHTFSTCRYVKFLGSNMKHICLGHDENSIVWNKINDFLYVHSQLNIGSVIWYSDLNVEAYCGRLMDNK